VEQGLALDSIPLRVACENAKKGGGASETLLRYSVSFKPDFEFTGGGVAQSFLRRDEEVVSE
jgi:hypothetical protein